MNEAIEDIKNELSAPRIEKALQAEYGFKPKWHEGHYGKKYDYYTCGQCGATVKYGVGENYCYNCGYRIVWDSPRCLTGYKSTERADKV